MPNNKNIFEHPYYSEEELVKRLKTKELVIVNQPELIHYFKTFNYHNVINKYKTCFLANIHYWRYLRNANSQMIIDLFNFNRKLSLLITPDLETIELQLATGIANVLMKRIGLFHAGRTIFGCLTAIVILITIKLLMVIQLQLFLVWKKHQHFWVKLTLVF